MSVRPSVHSVFPLPLGPEIKLIDLECSSKKAATDYQHKCYNHDITWYYSSPERVLGVIKNDDYKLYNGVTTAKMDKFLSMAITGGNVHSLLTSVRAITRSRIMEMEHLEGPSSFPKFLPLRSTTIQSNRILIPELS